MRKTMNPIRIIHRWTSHKEINLYIVKSYFLLMFQVKHLKN